MAVGHTRDWCNNPHYNYQSANYVSSSPPRGKQRRAYLSYLGPIERHRKETRSGPDTKLETSVWVPFLVMEDITHQVCNGDVIGSKPRDDIKVTECGHQ